MKYPRPRFILSDCKQMGNNTQRDKDIVRLYKEGTKVPRIAMKFDLQPKTVYGIIRSQMAEEKKGLSSSDVPCVKNLYKNRNKKSVSPLP